MRDGAKIDSYVQYILALIIPSLCYMHLHPPHYKTIIIFWWDNDDDDDDDNYDYDYDNDVDDNNNNNKNNNKSNYSNNNHNYISMIYS